MVVKFIRSLLEWEKHLEKALMKQDKFITILDSKVKLQSPTSWKLKDCRRCNWNCKKNSEQNYYLKKIIEIDLKLRVVPGLEHNQKVHTITLVHLTTNLWDLARALTNDRTTLRLNQLLWYKNLLKIRMYLLTTKPCF